MSVITECRPGDQFVCIQEFSACPMDEPFSWTRSKRFQVGERLRFVEHRRNSRLREHSEAHMVVFDARDGNRYSATQTYFVTDDCWRGIVREVTRKSRKSPKGLAKNVKIASRKARPAKAG